MKRNSQITFVVSDQISQFTQFQTEIFDPDDADNPDAFSTCLQIVNLWSVWRHRLTLRLNRHMWGICSSRYAITNKRTDRKRYEIFAKKGNRASHARDRGKGEENSYFCRWKTWMGPFPEKVAILGMDGNMNSGSWPRDLVRFVRSGTLKTWGRLN